TSILLKLAFFCYYNCMVNSQDPLAALQQLLEEHKTPSQNSTPTKAEGILGKIQTETSTEQTSEATNEADSTFQAEELALLEKNKEEEDRSKITEELDKMQTEIKNSPQYQQRLTQKEAADAAKKIKELEERSKQIVQLKHLNP
ncbi:MAG TPA: hypothetical protein PLQ50_00035, partial [Candidatus Woesebacteria bacterium]|nr:hypothetical protein [Candidatus Woesebacteria bacterium]